MFSWIVPATSQLAHPTTPPNLSRPRWSLRDPNESRPRQSLPGCYQDRPVPLARRNVRLGIEPLLLLSPLFLVPGNLTHKERDLRPFGPYGFIHSG